jgi:hypothetical protein
MNKNRIMSGCHSFFQNKTGLVVIVILLTLLVSACGNVPATQPSGSVLSQVEAAVTATLSAQATASAQANSSATPTAPLLPTATPTPSALPTTIPATATPQTLYSTYDYTNYGCEDSQFIKDVTIPDDTILTPGETFVKTWKFENTGSCAWGSDFSIVFVHGDDLDGSDTGIGQTVKSNKKAEISVELTAPDEEGTYTGYWRLADEYGNLFGETVYVEIVVKDVTAPGQTTLISPTGTITAITPTYTWYEVSGATNYLLQVNGPSGTVFQGMYSTSEANCNGTMCSIAPALTLGDGIYTWWIQAWNSGGWGQASNGLTFIMSSPTPASTSVPTSTTIATQAPTQAAPTSTSVATGTLTPTTALTETVTGTNTLAPTSTPTLQPLVTDTPLPTEVPTEMSNPTATATSIEIPTATETVPPSTATPTPKPTETEHHHHA